MSEIIAGKPQLAPGVCFICELSNDVRYIDTLRDFYGIVKERIDGRKYLCEECVEDAAKKFGFAVPAEVKRLKITIDELSAKNAKLNEDLAKFQDLKAVIDHFGGTKQATVSVKPRKAA